MSIKSNNVYKCYVQNVFYTAPLASSRASLGQLLLQKYLCKKTHNNDQRTSQTNTSNKKKNMNTIIEMSNELKYLHHNMTQLNAFAKNAIIYVTSPNKFDKPECYTADNCCKLVKTQVQAATKTCRATLYITVEYPVHSGTHMSLQHFRKVVKQLLDHTKPSISKYYFLKTGKAGRTWYSNSMRWGFRQVKGLDSLVYAHTKAPCNSIVFDKDNNDMLKTPFQYSADEYDEEPISSDDDAQDRYDNEEYKQDCSDHSEDNDSGEEESELEPWETPSKPHVHATPRSLRAKKRNRETANMDDEERPAKRSRQCVILQVPEEEALSNSMAHYFAPCIPSAVWYNKNWAKSSFYTVYLYLVNCAFKSLVNSYSL